MFKRNGKHPVCLPSPDALIQSAHPILIPDAQPGHPPSFTVHIEIQPIAASFKLEEKTHKNRKQIKINQDPGSQTEPGAPTPRPRPIQLCSKWYPSLPSCRQSNLNTGRPAWIRKGPTLVPVWSKNTGIVLADFRASHAQCTRIYPIETRLLTAAPANGFSIALLIPVDVSATHTTNLEIASAPALGSDSRRISLPFFLALVFTVGAICVDQFFAPALYSSSPLWAAGFCLLLVWQRGLRGTRLSFRFPQPSFSAWRLLPFAAAHFALF